MIAIGQSIEGLMCADDTRDLKADPLKAGDVVTLRCGGPAMVVEGLTEVAGKMEPLIRCVWHLQSGCVTNEHFRECMLRPLKPWQPPAPQDPVSFGSAMGVGRGGYGQA